MTKNNALFFLCGGYTKRENLGLSLLKLEEKNDTLSEAENLAVLKNCTYLCQTKLEQGNFVFSITEKGAAVFSLCRPNGQISLKKLCQCQEASQTACHLCFRKSSHTLYMASYHDGRLQRYHFSPTEKTLHLQEELCFESQSVLPAQKSAHLHCAVLSQDEKTLFLADLGGDCLYLCPLNEQGALAKEPKKIALFPQGTGPRHLLFSPCENFLYVLGELNNKLYIFQKTKTEDDFSPLTLASTHFIVDHLKVASSFSLLQEIDLLAESKAFLSTLQNCEEKKLLEQELLHPSPAGAALRLSADGVFLYTSHRFANLLCVLKKNEKGHFSLVQSLSSRGCVPRDFVLSQKEKYLLAAHQESDTLCLFLRDACTGKLSFLKEKSNHPECVCLLEVF